MECQFITNLPSFASPVRSTLILNRVTNAGIGTDKSFLDHTVSPSPLICPRYEFLLMLVSQLEDFNKVVSVNVRLNHKHRLSSSTVG
jgi:hypothetical protein